MNIRIIVAYLGRQQACHRGVGAASSVARARQGTTRCPALCGLGGRERHGSSWPSRVPHCPGVIVVTLSYGGLRFGLCLARGSRDPVPTRPGEGRRREPGRGAGGGVRLCGVSRDP
ncbi:hypothetical protein E2C01_056763 [Portunus trituberculatus]|uniref:Uncharacterized protein n=1 Tax=Portunus trituberculatus TaxID=210409 RepID=A0A5B7H1H5_PORTR|nr:hypothetical protein [Portunus trituberculatus]